MYAHNTHLWHYVLPVSEKDYEWKKQRYIRMVDGTLQEFQVNNFVGATAVAQFCIVGYSGKWPCIVANMRSEVFVNAVNDAESDEDEEEEEGNESQIRVNAFKKFNNQHLTEFTTEDTTSLRNQVKKKCEQKVNVNSMLMKNKKYQQLESSLMKTSLMNHIDDGNALLNSMIPMIPKKLEDEKRSIPRKRIHEEMMHLNSKRSMIPMMPKKHDDIHHQIMQLKSILNSLTEKMNAPTDVQIVAKAAVQKSTGVTAVQKAIGVNAVQKFSDDVVRIVAKAAVKKSTGATAVQKLTGATSVQTSTGATTVEKFPENAVRIVAKAAVQKSTGATA
eukprot:g12099.t1